MTGEKYSIFVSSGMSEFKSEREVLKQKLGTFFSTFVYEEDAGARPQTIKDTFTDELVKCHLYLGIFGKGYGKYTIDEFNTAREKGIDCLIYKQNLKSESLRDDKLVEFLAEIERVENGLSICRFNTIDDLGPSIERDIGRWLKTRDGSMSTASESPKLELATRYYCNREDQYYHLLKIDNENEGKLHFLIIDGAKKQSHQSLVKRFSLEKTANDFVKGPITISTKGDLDRLKCFIQMKLYEKFGFAIGDDLSFKTFVDLIVAEGYEKVFLIFRIEEDLLGNKDAVEAIRWFSTDYCDDSCLAETSPDFYFFLTIRYNETGASRKRAIQKHLEKFKGYVKLDELDNVTTEHIIQWLEDQELSESPSIREELTETYFDEQTCPMELAEMNLTQLIKDFNSGKEELMNLLNRY